MKKINSNSVESSDGDFSESSSSLIARAGQIMAIMITLGLVSMISSMLVTESLNGDAAQINKAGALRMQAIRISRAYFANTYLSASKPSQAGDEKVLIKKEIHDFNLRLSHLLLGQHIEAKNKTVIELQYFNILKQWRQLNNKNQQTVQLTEDMLQNIADDFDDFVTKIDHLVFLFQLESEKKLSALRLIQGMSLLLILALASIVLVKLNRTIIMPLKQLVNVAEQAGKGNFDVKASYDKNNELGVLAHTINHMSDELKSTYQDFEQHVDEKTQALTRSNQALDILYRAARNLAGYTLSEKSNASYQIDHVILQELEQLIGFGKVTVELNDSKENSLIIDLYSPNISIDHICFNYHKFPLEKQSFLFGHLIWELPKNKQAEDWQQQILQAMADIIATAIELDQKRTSENRLVIIEERAVIARELHDSLAQSLSYLKVQMSLLTRKMQKELAKEQIEETIDDIKEGLNNAYLQLRELLTTFRLKLDDPSIKNALHGTIAEFSAKCQHTIEFNYHLPQNYLTANQEIHLLQIVREALSNIHRHAQASHACVSIELESCSPKKVPLDKIQVKIWDNGIGLPKPLGKQGHFGLGIMEERANSLGTQILFQRRQPKGTLITFDFSH